MNQPAERPSFSWPLAVVGVGGALLLIHYARSDGGLRTQIERLVTDDRVWTAMLVVYAFAVASTAYLGYKRPELRPGIATWFWA